MKKSICFEFDSKLILNDEKFQTGTNFEDPFSTKDYTITFCG